MPEELDLPALSVDQLRKIEEQRRLAEERAKLQPTLLPALPEPEEDNAGDADDSGSGGHQVNTLLQPEPFVRILVGFRGRCTAPSRHGQAAVSSTGHNRLHPHDSARSTRPNCATRSRTIGTALILVRADYDGTSVTQSICARWCGA
jgi:hypothetical protein